jgi:hypothetical protein
MPNATLYSSQDPSAPALDLGMSNSTIHGIVGMYNLLYPILVTGYGSGPTAKPGQGWTLVHANLPQGFKLRSPDGVYYTFCKGSAQTYAYAPSIQVYMSESITNLAVYPPVGVNVHSGDHAVDTGPSLKRHWLSLNYYNMYRDSWYVIARGSQVIIVLNYQYTFDSATGASPNEETSTVGGVMFLGNVKPRDPAIPLNGPQNSVVLGGPPNASYPETWNPSSESYHSILGGGCTRLRTHISGAVETGILNRLYGKFNVYNGYAGVRLAIEAYAPDLVLEQTNLVESGVGSHSLIPGLFHSYYYSHRNSSALLLLLGKASARAEFLIPVSVAGEDFYIIPTTYGSMFVSLLEKYW